MTKKIYITTFQRSGDRDGRGADSDSQENARVNKLFEPFKKEGLEKVEVVVNRFGGDNGCYETVEVYATRKKIGTKQRQV